MFTNRDTSYIYIIVNTRIIEIVRVIISDKIMRCVHVDIIEELGCLQTVSGIKNDNI